MMPPRRQLDEITLLPVYAGVSQSCVETQDDGRDNGEVSKLDGWKQRTDEVCTDELLNNHDPSLAWF